MSSRSPRMSVSPTFSAYSQVPSSRSSSTSSASGIAMDRNLLLLSTAYQLPLSAFGDRLSSKLSNASPTYELSDPIAQNFDFEDLFDFDESLSRELDTKAAGSASSRRQASSSNIVKVGVTHPRTSTIKPRRQARHHAQPPQDLSEVPESQELRRFSFSHYPPMPQTTSRSLDSSSRRRDQRDVPTRTSPGAARLHEMLARGR